MTEMAQLNPESTRQIPNPKAYPQIPTEMVKTIESIPCVTKVSSFSDPKVYLNNSDKDKLVKAGALGVVFFNPYDGPLSDLNNKNIYYRKDYKLVRFSTENRDILLPDKNYGSLSRIEESGSTRTWIPLLYIKED